MSATNYNPRTQPANTEIDALNQINATLRKISYRLEEQNQILNDLRTLIAEK